MTHRARLKAIVIAEKRSVAEKIAKAFLPDGWKPAKTASFFDCEIGRIVWTNGHLLGLAAPEDIEPSWQKWQTESLPMLPTPEQWFTKALNEAAQIRLQFLQQEIVKSAYDLCVVATDPGREGQLIAQWLLQGLQLGAPIYRLWLQSLDAASIRSAWEHKQLNDSYAGLGHSAEARARSDWLVGLNLSRYYSIHLGALFPVGRVQTPTLQLVKDRENQISGHLPSVQWSLSARLDSAPWEAKLCESVNPLVRVDDLQKRQRSHTRFSADKKANWTPQLTLPFRIEVSGRYDQEFSENPPPFYNLLDIQIDANRLLNYSAAQTAALCQELYEVHELISYPRTESRTLPTALVAEQQALAQSFAQMPSLTGGLCVEPELLKPLPESHLHTPESHHEHYALVPVQTPVTVLRADLASIFELISRRWFQAFMGPVRGHTSVITLLPSEEGTRAFWEKNKLLWVIEIRQISDSGFRKDQKELPGRCEKTLPVQGEHFSVAEFQWQEHPIPAPALMSEAELLRAMTKDTANSQKTSSSPQSESSRIGLGTAATRAAVIESLKEDGYLHAAHGILTTTAKAKTLLEQVHPLLRSTQLTSRWESMLAKIEGDKLVTSAFLDQVARFLREVIFHVEKPMPSFSPLIAEPNENASSSRTSLPGPALEKKPSAYKPPSKKMVREVLLERFKITDFRPHQEDVCMAVAAGKDALLVMPTGCGKSLCYQLPGLLRGGKVLVLSPLISLMQNQASHLSNLGIAAGLLHSGLTRDQSRDICSKYRDQSEFFLFIAPERLGLGRFLEFLHRYPPNLIAIDEAHCISGWGHDFRPDYRLIGSCLESLKEIPKIALTATAGQQVQADIVSRLKMKNPHTVITGFRRTNIAIEVDYVEDSHKSKVVHKIAEDVTRLPMIIYTPTRKLADTLAASFPPPYKAAAYHAGLPSSERQAIIDHFLAGNIDIMVATVAFGMGIDKANIRTVVHYSVPGNPENYYQEIGRAGRDGKLSRAILLYSWEDWRIQEYLLNKSYPDAKNLQKVSDLLAKSPKTLPQLQAALGYDPEELTALLEKLRGLQMIQQLGQHFALREGAPSIIDEGYAAQVSKRKESLQFMDQFTRSSACRMSTIVGYFTNDPNQLKPCGICDICFPNYSSLGIRQKLSDEDLKRCRIILETLADYPQVAKGKLWKEMPGGWQQGEFDALLACLEQYGMIKIKREQFQKKDHLIHFQKITLLSPPSVSLQELSRIYPGKAKASKSPRALGPKKAALIPANLNKS